MDCTHVWNYEMALSKLFPDLERSMRRTDLVDQMCPRGVIPTRTPLPLYLPRPWDQRLGRNPAIDGELGTVLKTYREVRHGAGRRGGTNPGGTIRSTPVRSIRRWPSARLLVGR